MKSSILAVLCLSLVLSTAGCSEMSNLFKGAQPTKQAATSKIEAPKPAPAKPVAPLTSVDMTAPILNPPVPQPEPAVSPAPVHLADGKTHVAVLLPLSGKNAALGQAMLNAAQMAVFDLAGDRFELMPRDTGATATSAAEAAQESISSGAELLIGPLFAADVAAVKPVVQTSAVNMLALSSDVSLASPGAYVIGFAPSSLVNRIVDYATHKSLYRFSAVLPSGAFGRLVQQAFVSEVAKRRGTVVDIETYGSKADMERAVKNVMAKKDQTDALFVPAGGAELTQIAALLEAEGFYQSHLRLLGSGLWDEAPLGKTPVLIGGWYAAAEHEARESFEKRYADTYGQAPPRLASLAYDATALAVVLSRRGSFDRAALANPSGFAGLDGIFRLTPAGTAERGLAIHEVTAEGTKIVDPSPSTFVGMAP